MLKDMSSRLLFQKLLFTLQFQSSNKTYLVLTFNKAYGQAQCNGI